MHIFFFVSAGLIRVRFRERLSLYMHSAMWARAELANEGCIHALKSFYLSAICCILASGVREVAPAAEDWKATDFPLST
jgi:hypothetical protein